MRRTGIVALIAAALGAAPLPGQRVIAAVTGSWAEHRVEAGLGTEVSSGPLLTFGAGVGLFGRLDVTGEATVGKLSPDGIGEERDMAELSLALRYRLFRWLAVDAGAAARSYTAPIARQHWTIGRVGAEARVPLGRGRMAGVWRIAALPLVDVNGLPSPDLGLAAAAGVEYGVGRFDFRLQYWLERYDFPPQGAVTRLEQLTGVALRAAFRLGG